MPNIKLEDYYNRHDPGKNYDRILFRANRVLQSAEVNEVQMILGSQMKGMGDALFKDGDIIRDARIVVNEGSGQARCEAGLVYLAGAVRQVAEATLALPLSGAVAIGVVLSEKVITELEDPTLYNPAIGTRSEGEPGAARLQVEARWAVSNESHSGDFYPVHTVEDGNVLAKDPPPNLDSVTQALARYDRDSAGGTYAVSGLTVRRADDTPEGHQVYTVAEGRARVFGYAVELATSRRLLHAAVPDLLYIESEPHLSSGAASQRVELDRYPVKMVDRIRFTKETTATLTHGAYIGCLDPLPDNSVVELLEISQGGLTYTEGEDYKLTAGRVDWSPQGQEPAPHSTYSARYRHIVSQENPVADASGLSVSGAVSGTQIFVDYSQMLPRYDRLCLTREGAFTWVIGVSAEWNPQPPQVGDDLLAIATVHQTWDAARRVVNDGVRVVSMDDIAAINERLDGLTEHVAQQRLSADIFTREAGAKKGLFVDPFLSDEMRDQGLAQTGAIVGGCLTLPISLAQVAGMTDDLNSPARLEYVPVMVLEQLLRTGEMKINAYDALAPLPAEVTLTPAIDRWTEIKTEWKSSVTQQFVDRTLDGYYHKVIGTETKTTTETLSKTTSDLEFLRQIEVAFSVSGLGPKEKVQIAFDGLAVVPKNSVADESGVLVSSFEIPPDIPAGAKSVIFTGSGGSSGQAVFVGQGQLTVQVLRNVISRYRIWVDPLAQTFALTESCQLCGVELWFTAKHSSRVIVQIRETTVGLPNASILGEAILEPGDLNVDGSATRAIFNVPVTVAAETEYAIVIMCDDPVTSVAVAELGKWDLTYERWVTAQPYQIGVLLSSSNASTWTAHQSFDLTFRLLKAIYSQSSAEIDLGEVYVDAVTDLMLLPIAEQPVAQSRAEYRLSLPGNSSISVADRQSVRLSAPVTGAIGVKARLSGTPVFSPILHPGAQLVSGAVALEADYISRAVPAGLGSLVKVILDADLPSGSRVAALMCADGQNVWQEMEFKNSRPLDEGWQELIFESPTEALLVRVKLILTGTVAARPRVDNLRVLTV